MSALRGVAAQIEDRALVRAEVGTARIKTLASVHRKARQNGWNDNAALNNCGDLVGARVVCNNIVDVYRFTELLKERFQNYGNWLEVQNYIKRPSKAGYRALHVNLSIDVGSNPMAVDFVSCEVQVRTRLQDAWAELAHHDIYKQPELPDDLRARAGDLAEVLAAADKIAEGIRSRVMQEVTPSKKRPNLEKFTPLGVAYIFKNIFGRAPADHVVRRVLSVSRELCLSSLDRLADVLGDEGFRAELASAYAKIMGMNPSNEDILLASLQAVEGSKAKAIRQIKRVARREWKEIDQIAGREILSSLPETIEQLIGDLENPQSEPDILGMAEALGATSACAICGTTIVQTDTFAEATMQHYGIADPDAIEAAERIEQALYNSGTEVGGWSSSSLCAYHADRADKD